MSTSRIARRLMLPVQAVLPVLTRLEAGGLVVRRRDAADRRMVRVSLTTAGADLGTAATAVQHEVVGDTGLDTGTVAELRDRLRSLADNLDLVQTTRAGAATSRLEP